jgi:hypothetical protein
MSLTVGENPISESILNVLSIESFIPTTADLFVHGRAPDPVLLESVLEKLSTEEVHLVLATAYILANHLWAS